MTEESFGIQFWRERIGYYSLKQKQRGIFSAIWSAKLYAAWNCLKEQQLIDAEDLL